jgi:hypothetical protein
MILAVSPHIKGSHQHQSIHRNSSRSSPIRYLNRSIMHDCAGCNTLFLSKVPEAESHFYSDLFCILYFPSASSSIWGNTYYRRTKTERFCRSHATCAKHLLLISEVEIRLNYIDAWDNYGPIVATLFLILHIYLVQTYSHE